MRQVAPQCHQNPDSPTSSFTSLLSLHSLPLPVVESALGTRAWAMECRKGPQWHHHHDLPPSPTGYRQARQGTHLKIPIGPHWPVGYWQPGTVTDKGRVPYICRTSSPSPFKSSAHPLPRGRQPLSPCSVFRKPLSPLFCLRWILSLPTPSASTQLSPHIWAPPHPIGRDTTFRHHTFVIKPSSGLKYLLPYFEYITINDLWKKKKTTKSNLATPLKTNKKPSWWFSVVWDNVKGA